MILHVLRTEQVQQIQQTAISVLSSEYDRGFYSKFKHTNIKHRY
jgi:hypothetical protein